MYRRSQELSRLAFALFVRGVLLVVLGALAIRWPNHSLLFGMIVAGGVIGSIGIFEVATAAVSRALPSTRLFYIGHGLVSIGLGAITATIPVAQLGTAVVMCIVFVLAYGMFSLVLAARLQFVRRARDATLVWALFNVACALLLSLSRITDVTDLMYGGALYGALLGLLQLVAAVWIHRGQQLMDRIEASVPFAAPR